MRTSQLTSHESGAIQESHSCNTSLRTRSIVDTIGIARRIGPALGISRVTDVTRLDRIGIPVFVSIRPTALPGSLCVNAGKGITPGEACVGAWMEAIEYALAEPGAAGLTIVEATPRDILDGDKRPRAVLDFCPYLDRRILLDEPMDCVWAEETFNGGKMLVPAERVFVPFFVRDGHTSYFGYSTCGLASGNTIEEAMAHGLAEVIEHDICSVQVIDDQAVDIRLESLPQTSRRLIAAIKDAGLYVRLRFRPNIYSLPHVECLIVDEEAGVWRYRNSGYGCHPHSEIAVNRAICEAAQSRLSFIHGGRDDLVEMDRMGARADIHRAQSKRPAFEHRCNEIDFTSVPDASVETPCVNSCLHVMEARLTAVGVKRILLVTFTNPGSELQVVKVIVPEMEEFDSSMPRVGPRLAAYASSL